MVAGGWEVGGRIERGGESAEYRCERYKAVDRKVDVTLNEEVSKEEGIDVRCACGGEVNTTSCCCWLAACDLLSLTQPMIKLSQDSPV